MKDASTDSFDEQYGKDVEFDELFNRWVDQQVDDRKERRAFDGDYYGTRTY